MPEPRPGIEPNTQKVVVPTAYFIRSIIMTNHRGDKIDIENIVADFSISESIYSPTLILKMNFKDSGNFIEQWEICGQETIRISLARQGIPDDEKETFDHEFYVTEYPMFARPIDSTQVFSCRGVSRHAYISGLTMISRAVAGNTIDIASGILTSDLGIERKNQVLDRSTSVFEGIIPRFEPLLAIDWLRRRTYDQNSCPCFFYETMSGKVHLRTLTSLFEEETYRTYSMTELSGGKSLGEEDYLTRATKIMDITSDIKMSKMFQSQAGAFSGKALHLDIASKKFHVESYDDLAGKRPMIDKYPILSPHFRIRDKNLGQISSYGEYISTNSNVPNYSGLAKNNSLRATSSLEKLESICHDITIAGDFDLASGRKINLRIPKPLVPEFIGSGSPLDVVMSGNYLVTSVVHSFSSIYTCSVRIKKDSLAFDLSK